MKQKQNYFQADFLNSLTIAAVSIVRISSGLAVLFLMFAKKHAQQIVVCDSLQTRVPFITISVLKLQLGRLIDRVCEAADCRSESVDISFLFFLSLEKNITPKSEYSAQ